MPPFENTYFESSYQPVKLRACDHPGCDQAGDYRAPKEHIKRARNTPHHTETPPDPSHDYHWFCLNHVRAYNSQWDYFAGLSSLEIEKQIRKATVWERPTWPLGSNASEQQLRDHVMREFFSSEAPSDPPPPPAMRTERDALHVLELSPPITFTAIKAQYRILVKRHHPDTNNGSPEAEEKFKAITQAFSLLKQLYTDEP